MTTMSGNKIDPQQFFDGTDNVALLVPGTDLFGLMRRTINLPAAWSALVTQESGSHSLVRPGQTLEGDSAVEDVFFVRVTPNTLVFDEMTVTSQDGFRCAAKVVLQVSVIPDRGDLASFRKMMLGSRRMLRNADLLVELTPVLRSAVVAGAGTCDAGALVDGRAAEPVDTMLRSGLKGKCFESGLVVAGELDVVFESDAARRVQESREEVVRRAAEHEAGRELRQALATAQREHVDHLSELLQRLTALASESPGTDLSTLIQTFSEKQRGELYAALFASDAAPTSTAWVVVAAGAELLFYTPSDLGAPKRRLTVSGVPGNVRSVQTAQDADGSQRLLLGAASGIYSMRLDQSVPDQVYAVEQTESVRGGFNSVVTVAGSVYGSHSELGLRRWDVDDPRPAESLFESLTGPAKTVRGVCAYGDDLCFGVDDQVVRWRIGSPDRPSQLYTGSTGSITSLCVTENGVFAGNSDGDVMFWAHGQEDHPARMHGGSQRAAESVCVLSGGGVKRLVYTDTSLSVRARVLGDSFICHYEAGGQTLRRAEVAPDLIVATSELRDRVICWAPHKPGKPHGIILVSSITGRSVQDVCLVPMV